MNYWQYSIFPAIPAVSSLRAGLPGSSRPPFINTARASIRELRGIYLHATECEHQNAAFRLFCSLSYPQLLQQNLGSTRQLVNVSSNIWLVCLSDSCLSPSRLGVAWGLRSAVLFVRLSSVISTMSSTQKTNNFLSMNKITLFRCTKQNIKYYGCVLVCPLQ